MRVLSLFVILLAFLVISCGNDVPTDTCTRNSSDCKEHHKCFKTRLEHTYIDDWGVITQDDVSIIYVCLKACDETALTDTIVDNKGREIYDIEYLRKAEGMKTCHIYAKTGKKIRDIHGY